MGTVAAPYDPERSVRSMERRNGALGTFAVDHVLGNLWSRPQLSRRDRSLIVITFLCTIGADDELRVHTRAGVNHGLERHEIYEIVNQVAGYAGFPMAMAATRIVDEVLAELDGVERLPPKEPAASVDDPDQMIARVVEVAVEESARAGVGNVAVITPRASYQEVIDAFEAAGVTIGSAPRDGLDHPITAVPVNLVKGLEVDVAVVVEPADIVDQEPQGYRSLYVAMTRVTKRLALVHARPLPEVLTS